MTCNFVLLFPLSQFLGNRLIFFLVAVFAYSPVRATAVFIKWEITRSTTFAIYGEVAFFAWQSSIKTCGPEVFTAWFTRRGKKCWRKRNIIYFYSDFPDDIRDCWFLIGGLVVDKWRNEKLEFHHRPHNLFKSFMFFVFGETWKFLLVAHFTLLWL